MYKQVEKTKENKSRSIANSVAQKQIRGNSTFQFVDNRPEAIAQRKIQEVINTNETAQLVTIYRGMQASVPEADSPLLGNTNGFQLGVRSTEGTDNDGGYVNPASGGMSTSSPKSSIPNFTASKHYTEGNHNTDDKTKQSFRWIWSFGDGSLPDSLVARNDHDDHYSIEPAEEQELTRDQFQSAVQGTQSNWTRIDD